MTRTAKNTEKTLASKKVQDAVKEHAEAMDDLIDLSSLIGEVKRHERRVHGRKVVTEDIEASDIPTFEKLFGRLTFEAIYAGARVVLKNAEITPAFDQKWFDSIPYDEAVQLCLQQIDPDIASKDIDWMKPIKVKLSASLAVEFPVFTLGDARFFMQTLENPKPDGSILLERVTYLFEQARLVGGKSLPKGLVNTLKRQQLLAIIDLWINGVQKETEGNDEAQ
jgi:hypothetical protein